MEVQGEIKAGEEANIVKIVTANLIKKFGTDARVLKEAKQILKGSNGENVPEETVQSIRDAYEKLKSEDYASVLN